MTATNEIDMTENICSGSLHAGGLDDPLATSRAIREHCGGISEITLYRWRNTLNFPKPYMQNGKVNYWKWGDVMEWLAERNRKTAEVL